MKEVHAMNQYPGCVKTVLYEVLQFADQQRKCFVKDPEKDFTRSRTYDFKTLLLSILSLGSNTLNTEIQNFFACQDCPTNSAFVQRRQKVLPEAFRFILHEFNRRMNENPQLFYGYRLLAIDGSSLTLPYNPAEPENIRTKEHYNYMHLNSLYDVLGKCFLDALVSPGTKSGESRAAANMVDSLSDRFPVILTADRNYEQYNLFAHAEERLFDYVIRIKDIGSSGILSGIDLPDEETFDITRNLIMTRHSSGPALVNPKTYKYFARGREFDYLPDLNSDDYPLTIRFVRFQLADGTFLTLATSLSEEDFPPCLLAELYHLRWGIETAYREAKHSLGMIYWHSKKAACIMQEVYAHLIMYNFSMYIAMRLKPAQGDRKHPVQINFTQAFKTCKRFFCAKYYEPPFDVEALILKYVEPVRDGRSFPRVTVSPKVKSFAYRVS